jgi:hypothetical protein
MPVLFRHLLFAVSNIWRIPITSIQPNIVCQSKASPSAQYSVNAIVCVRGDGTIVTCSVLLTNLVLQLQFMTPWMMMIKEHNGSLLPCKTIFEATPCATENNDFVFILKFPVGYYRAVKVQSEYVRLVGDVVWLPTDRTDPIAARPVLFFLENVLCI